MKITTHDDIPEEVLRRVVRRKLPRVTDIPGRESGTLEPSKADGLDFVELAVWDLREALADAYRAGTRAGIDGELRTLFLVTDPTEVSELGDIVGEVSPVNLAQTIQGADRAGRPVSDETPRIYLDEESAEQDGELRLLARNVRLAGEEALELAEKILRRIESFQEELDDLQERIRLADGEEFEQLVSHANYLRTRIGELRSAGK